MREWSESVLGRGIIIDRRTVELMLHIGPERHMPAVTDPSATRSERIESRREWPDSLMSDVPDRAQLFELFGPVDIIAWPELGTAIDDRGRVAAHLPGTGCWSLIDNATGGDVVLEHHASGDYSVRTITHPPTHSRHAFVGPLQYIAAVAYAKAELTALAEEAKAPQDRGG